MGKTYWQKVKKRYEFAVIYEIKNGVGKCSNCQLKIPKEKCMQLTHCPKCGKILKEIYVRED